MYQNIYKILNSTTSVKRNESKHFKKFKNVQKKLKKSHEFQKVLNFK